MKRIVTSILLIATIAGCSTAPVTSQNAQAVPSARIYQPAMIGAATDAQQGTVVFLRDAGFLGSGCSHDVYVDNVKAFAIRHGEEVSIHLAPGDHVFRLETGGGLCPNISTSQETMLAAGEREVFRILIPSDGNLRLTRIQ
jgi:hypothetical protein